MRRLPNIGALVVLGSLFYLLEWHSGAWHADFDLDSDEAAHAVSSLLVRDYIAGGMPGSPLEFAKTYYVHYPKVSIGHYPPLFYVGETVWMLVFGRSRAAMLDFVGCLTFALLVSVFLVVRRHWGSIPAFLSALALALPTFMQETAWSISPNAMLALLAFWAAATYAKYVETSRTVYLWGYFLILAASVAAHGRGVAVVLIPIFVWVLQGRFTLRRAAVSVAILAVLLAVPPLIGQAFLPSPAAALSGAWLYLRGTVVSFGWPVVAVAVFGALDQRNPLLLVMTALALSGWAALVVMHVPFENRFLCLGGSAMAVLFGAGLHRLYQGVVRLPRPWRISAAAAVVCAFGWWAATSVRFGRKLELGYSRLAAPPGTIYLVAGDAVHEGALISEVALRDPDRKDIVLRASKVLSQSSLLGDNYRMLFPNSAEVEAYLDDAHVTVIAVESGARRPHIPQLLEALNNHPSEWVEVHDASTPRGARVFRRSGPVPAGPVRIRIDMRRKHLGILEN